MRVRALESASLRKIVPDNSWLVLTFSPSYCGALLSQPSSSGAEVEVEEVVLLEEVAEEELSAVWSALFVSG